MRLLFLLVTGLIMSVNVFSQIHYTYQTDHTFTKKEDFIGVEIIPSDYQRRDGNRGGLDYKENTFLMTPVYFVFTEGETIYRYTISSLSETKYGFQGLLMDIKNPSNQAKVKYILTNRNHLAAVIFKPGSKEPEVIYTLPELEKDIIRKEANYFTTKDLLIINEPADASIWNNEIVPFFEQSNYKRRLYADEKNSFEFIRDTTSTTETKKGPKYTFSDSFIYQVDGGEKTTCAVNKTKAKDVGNGTVLTFSISDPVDGNFDFVVFVGKNNTIENIDFKGKRYLLRGQENMPDKYPLVVKKKVAPKKSAPKVEKKTESPAAVEESITEEEEEEDYYGEDEEEEEEYYYEEEEDDGPNYDYQSDRLEGFPDWFNR